ncbi:iron only hydrogenase large subunit, C-terminal domain-containing protein [Neospora caninum Liverpool]|uniref:Iron only hydrogenase large subunit, C-terminal domain-containing protein n=1 Tax=Neospora caninum (strain Liverpool) TaxID=572307 RepID=F0VE26_NEOCL|nr:iron only hydrogenase large subunit, C-terminal domain-containing protein [Neospora caninum Liverpool]CBZ51969.1 iron only hydrogenase large subunit, C-terminal domain-containing protein [Neospora caninum Liverpool]CEL65930.1 TPA: iron only hydrogenase large subunit, C-terminal domain-containing protein, putative [Neospora caninum Liverpool]|eukprot:XP_003882002.1 iron only hydrogenase large subunit, C-terminal domain-containing protein [Neospora caninum Liverpool]
MAPVIGANPSFSAAVKLADLDDYLAPAQNCVVPLLTEKPQHDQASTTPVSGRAGRNGPAGLGRTAIQPVDSVHRDEFNQGPRVNDTREHQRANLIRLARPSRATASVGADHGTLAGGNRNREGVANARVETGNNAPYHSSAQMKENAVDGGIDNGLEPSTAVAKVSLYDCLACSGCVTSAEAVLLDHHSVDQFLQSVRNSSARSVTVVSVSFQSIIALAHEFRSSPGKTLRRLSTLFRLAGATYVLHTQVSDAVAVLEAEREFVRRYREAAGRAARETARLKTTDEGSREQQGNLSSAPRTGHSIDETTLPRVPGNGLLPVLTSFCPGLVCYAEKSLHPSLLPYFSRVRSSQQVQGVLVKGLLRESHNARSFFFRWRVANPLTNWFVSTMMKCTLSRYCHLTAASDGPVYQSPAFNSLVMTENGDTHSADGDVSRFRVQGDSGAPANVEWRRWSEELTPKDIFHVCVMPCFDKKLEAARPEFRTHVASASDGRVSTSAVSRHVPLSGSSDEAVASPRRTSQSDGGVPDVDLVLATNEVLTLMQRLNLTFDELDESPVDEFCDDFSRLACQISLSLGSSVADHPLVSDATCSLTQGAAPEDSTLQMTRRPSDQEKSTTSSVNLDPESRRMDAELIRPSEFLSGSGGYTDRVFRRAAWELFGVRVEGPLQFTHGRNEDYKEVALVVDGEEKLRFAIAYGFRNIRNVVQRLKREVGEETSGHNSRDRVRSTLWDPSNLESTAPPHDDILIDGTAPNLTGMSRGRSKRTQRPFPHFIELAACPGGCLNGAGQTLSQWGTERGASNNSDGYNSRNSISNEVIINGKVKYKAERANDSDVVGPSGGNAGEEDAPGKVDASSVRPDCEAKKPLSYLTELLQSSFAFHDPLRWREVEQAYTYLQGRVPSASKTVTEEPAKMNKRQWSQLRHVRGRKESEAAVDWWQGAMNEEEEWEDLYTDFKSVSHTFASSSSATMASLKW